MFHACARGRMQKHAPSYSGSHGDVAWELSRYNRCSAEEGMCWEALRPGWRATAHTAVPGTHPWPCSPGGEATGLRAAASHGLYHEGVRALLKATLPVGEFCSFATPAP